MQGTFMYIEGQLQIFTERLSNFMVKFSFRGRKNQQKPKKRYVTMQNKKKETKKLICQQACVLICLSRKGHIK